MKPEPFRLEPKFVERLWGMRSLAPLFPEKTNLPEPIGEVWLTGVDCKIATGPYRGKRLAEAWREMPPEWRGTRFAEPGDFPVLIKFIFPNDQLSIQVHPDDSYAAAHEKGAGGHGKTEMWHVLSAKPGASLLLGLKPGVTKESFLKAVADHTLEDLFERHVVQAGDTYFVPARTPHTIGPNMVICEVQEYSDITYRVYDYGRVDAQGKPRELHLTKAMEVMHFGDSGSPQVKVEPLPSHEAFKFLLAACRYFATERWEFAWNIRIPSSPAQFDILVFLSGSGSLRSPSTEQDYQYGECWFVPGSMGLFELKPKENTTVLRTYIPDLQAFRRELAEEGVSRKSLASVLFE